MKTVRMVYEKSVRGFAYIVMAIVGALFPFILWSSARIIPTLILLFICGAYLRKYNEYPIWPIKKLWIAFWVVLIFVRVDVSFLNLPGPPRLVRYAIGLPSPQTMREARRGHVVLHGCVATGLEPFWIWVW